MRIYVTKISAKFHSNPIWNDRANLAKDVLKRSPQQEEKQQEQDEYRYEISS